MVAARTPDSKARAWAAGNLEDTQIFEDYDQSLENADLETAVVAGITAAHAE